MTRYDSRGFIIPNITGPFTVKIVLTEKPRAFTPEHIGVTNGKATAILAGLPFGGAASAAGLDVQTPPISEGNYTNAGTIPRPTGRDYQYHPYYVTITPDLRSADDIVIKVNAFEDTVKPPNRYIPPRLPKEGRQRLTLNIHPAATITPLPGFRVALPASRHR